MGVRCTRSIGVRPMTGGLDQPAVPDLRKSWMVRRVSPVECALRPLRLAATAPSMSRRNAPISIVL